tara:strand:+ start:1751 stop:2653 length:903 start_codon:yes stop_codon:yes gene_type:complete
MTTWTRETVDLSMESASLTVDNIKIDGSNIGHVDDTDLMALANGALTVNGTVTATGNITGTLATAAQTNITSLGTLTTLTVDNVIINGTTIGHTSDTDLLTLTSGNLAIAGNVTGITSLTVDNININGNTLSTTDTDGDMIFDTNGNGKYVFNHDGGGALAMHIVCSDSDGGWLHFMNSTTGSTADTDGWKVGMDSTESFQIYNEELDSSAIFVNTTNNNVKFFGNTTADSPCQVTIGDDGETEGHLILSRKGAAEFPSIKMFSDDGTASYLFVDDDGKLRIHSSLPTDTGDGTIVGTQS